MSNSVLVIAGGDLTDLDYLQKKVAMTDKVVAVDKGVEHLLKIGYHPKLVVGDMDSCDAAITAWLQETSCQLIQLPCEKSQTDLEAALDYCVKSGFYNIEVAAAFHGARIDHLLGTVMLLPKYVHQSITVRLVGPRGRLLQVIDKSIVLQGTLGTYVSLLALTSEVKGVTTAGLKYPLREFDLHQGMTLGVSNELVSEKARITIGNGLLLVIKEENK